MIRSKELEVLLSRARAAEQKQLAEGEKARADKLEEQVRAQSICVSVRAQKLWCYSEPADREGAG